MSDETQLQANDFSKLVRDKMSANQDCCETDAQLALESINEVCEELDISHEDVTKYLTSDLKSYLKGVCNRAGLMVDKQSSRRLF
ncbi:hypothetical protein [Vibrio phage YC]|uniref:Uncharacterized protein n=1 Tax=Vibrio phage YC TaxID=2267403 RepID=A0A384ZRX7_9CAUD|nr:hypothetical protein HWB64_gp028 [Vibrio phage YC]AXC34397.1 hypothetical protein [Vibrio phage YC]